MGSAFGLQAMRATDGMQFENPYAMNPFPCMLAIVVALCPMLATGDPAAPNFGELIGRLAADSFKERSEARKELVDGIADERSPALTMLSAARYSDDPEVRAQAGTALREVFGRIVLGAGRREIGVKLSYWFDRKDGATRFHPIILGVSENGFMAKAGFKEGDVLVSCGGKMLYSKGSVTAAKAILEQSPQGKPVECRVSRGTPKSPFGPRKRSLVLVAVPDAAKSEGRKEMPDEYEGWLETLGKSGTVPEGG